MEEDFRVIKKYLMIRMPRELDHHSALSIKDTADKYIEERDILHVIFDFEKTEFMDSSGIGVIMGRYQKIKYLGGRVMAIHVSPTLKRIFHISGLHKIVEIVEEAQESAPPSGQRKRNEK